MKSISLHITVIFLLVALVGCDKQPEKQVSTKTHVVLQLNWTPDPTFAGAFIAADNGTNFFSNEGLSVEIQPGGFGIDPIAVVASKKAEFAIVGADKAAVAFSNGAPIRIVAVEFQRNPVGWIVRKETGINNIQDVVNNNNVILGDKIGTETTSILNLILFRLHIEGKIKPQPVGFDFAYFIQNKNSIYPVYLNEEPATAKARGIDIIEIDPSAPNNGNIKMYGNVIIANKDYILTNKNTIISFIKGLRLGWKYAAEYREDAVTLLKKHQFFNNEQMPCVLARSVEFATSYYGAATNPESMSKQRWENTIKTLQEAKLLNKDIPIDSLVWFEGAD